MKNDHDITEIRGVDLSAKELMIHKQYNIESTSGKS